jgi:hypothetical protein
MQNETLKKFLADHCVQVKTFGGPDHQWVVYKVNSDNLSATSPAAQDGS